MLVEHSHLSIHEGREDAFVNTMNAVGIPLLLAVNGVRTVRMGRSVEQPDRFILLVEWESMDAHIAFTKAPAFPDFRSIVSPFAKGGGMEHFLMKEPAST